MSSLCALDRNRSKRSRRLSLIHAASAASRAFLATDLLVAPAMEPPNTAPTRPKAPATWAVVMSVKLREYEPPGQYPSRLRHPLASGQRGHAAEVGSRRRPGRVSLRVASAKVVYDGPHPG